MTPTPCPLCTGIGGTLVFQGSKFRVIRADEVGFPAFYRVAWTNHVPSSLTLKLLIEIFA